MLNKFILLFLLIIQLCADTELQKNYYIDSNNIHISDIIKNSSNDKLLYKIQKNKHMKKIKSKDLLKTLKEHGYKNIISKNRYINFIKKSPIDTSKIVSFLKQHYLEHYLLIDIKDIQVQPRAYMSSLPPQYTLEIRGKNHLSKSGIVSIKTPKNRKIFFNYYIDATVLVYMSRKQIKKDTELSALNTIKKTIPLDRFTAEPLQDLQIHTIQTKRNIREDRIITRSDIAGLNLVKKNTNISISFNSNNMSINFSAKALQSGRLNDIIAVRNVDGKKFKVKITGKNRAEMR